MLLKALFSSLPVGSFIEIRTFRPIPTQRFFTDPHKAQAYSEAQSKDKIDVYFGIAARDGNGGKKENVTLTRTLWLDYDKLYPQKPAYILPPSCVIASGSGSHIYFFLREQETDLAKLETELKALQKQHNSDPASTDAARVLRVPNTFNFKSEAPQAVIAKYAKPFYYEFEDFAAARTLPPFVQKIIQTGKTAENKTRSERDWLVIHECLKVGLSVNAIRAIFAFHPVGDKVAESPDHYFEHTLKEAKANTGEPISRGFKYYHQVGMATGPNGTYIITKDDTERLLSPVRFEIQAVATKAQNEKRDIVPEDSFLLTIHANGEQWDNITIPVKAFDSGSNLRSFLSVASWVWTGTDKQTANLRWMLVLDWIELGKPTVLTTDQLGIHLTANPSVPLLVTNSQTLTPSLNPTPTLVYTKPKKARPEIYIDLEATPQLEALQDVAETITKINAPDVILPILGWWVAALFKPQLNKLGYSFPHLVIHGPRGSGKTTTINQVLQPLFGFQKPDTYLSSATPFALLNLLGATTSIPICLTEHRESTSNFRFQQLLRAAYDTGKETRGQRDQTTVEYPLTSPLCLDGEDSVTDPAIQERVIAIALGGQAVQSLKHRGALRKCLQLDLKQWVAPFCQYAMENYPLLLELYDQAINLFQQAFPETLPARTQHNHAISVMGLILLDNYRETKLALPRILVSPKQIRKLFINTISELVNLATGSTALIVDTFIEDCINEIARTQANPPFTYKLSSNGSTVGFHLASAYSWWVQLRHRKRQETTEVSSLRLQLRERENHYYKGKKYGHIGEIGSSVQLYWVDLAEATDFGLDIPKALILGSGEISTDGKIIKLNSR